MACKCQERMGFVMGMKAMRHPSTDQVGRRYEGMKVRKHESTFDPLDKLGAGGLKADEVEDASRRESLCLVIGRVHCDSCVFVSFCITCIIYLNPAVMVGCFWDRDWAGVLGLGRCCGGSCGT